MVKKLIRAAVTHTPDSPYKIEEVELAEPKNDEVLVKIVACGLCHTDEFGKQIGIRMPIVLGHEGAGIIEKTGADVKGFEVGDHVVFSFATCGHCRSCVSGQPAYCENFNQINFGGIGADGTTKLFQDGKELSMFFGQSSFAQYSTVNARNIVKVDKDVDLSMVAPFGCGIQTGAGAVLNAIKPNVEDSIAVFGCGAVGMSAIMAAKVAGCRQIIAVGGNARSLELAKELGATDVVNRKMLDDNVTIAEAEQEVSHGGVNYAIDTSGNGNMIMNAIKATAYHGTIVVLAPTGKLENLDVGAEILMMTRTIRPCYEGDSVPQIFIPRLVQLYKEGKFPVDKIIEQYAFEDIEQARIDSDSGKVIKAVVVMNEQG
ncbi:MAG: NAD(P)-dependent alcohol dehydrogenase [Lachnospiraceae bacterium]|nr:NAD(P)-dependent alcohol dehydrogenase [Lachnospiraceae bacterium]